jgi:deazaflavin-dependent oxidoreductase (nitroreductase family)
VEERRTPLDRPGEALEEKIMVRAIATLVVALLVVLVVLGTVFLVGMRTNARPVLRAVRRFNRAFVNPHAMKKAGTPGVRASIVRHVGRTSGRTYETPVEAFATDDGFLVALPYGPDTDWLKNVLASGSATIVDDGSTYLVDQPQLVPTAVAAPDLPANEQRTLRLFAVEQCLRVRRAEPEDPTSGTRRVVAEVQAQ